MARSSLEPTWIGLEVNATRARAVTGPGRQSPRVLALDGALADLPLAIALARYFEKPVEEVFHANGTT